MEKKYYDNEAMESQKSSKGENMERISVSVPKELVRRFDDLVAERGFSSRSQAFSELLAREIDRNASEEGLQIMTGTIVLVYEHAKRGVKKRLADLQYQYVNEVISSLHIFLEHERTMEVVLVQGQARRLRKIANEFITCKGVISGSLTLTASLMPPIQHPKQ